MHAGAGPDIDDVVRVADRVLVVFYHQHGVTQISQMNQGSEQTLIVALV